MSMKLNSIEVKRQNKKRIFRYLLKADTVTKQEISSQLRLSLPTVSQIISELGETGLVYEAGMQASSGGRRAVTVCADGEARLAAGIDITKNHVDFAIINLRGDILVNERMRKAFSQSEAYRQELREMHREFLGKHQIDEGKLIGLGVSLPGIVSEDQKMLQYSHILGLKEPMAFGTIELPYQIRFFNDATAACMAECYAHTAPPSFTFLSLSNSVGGATVFQNQIVMGDNCRNGELGHICLVPGGRPCYCGKAGHYDAYGSALVLTNLTNGSMSEFFERLGKGERHFVQVFDEYLEYLALMLHNLHIQSDLPVVIGGYVGSYLKPYLKVLKEKVDGYSIFEEQKEYMYLCKYNVEASAVGAARYFVEQFIENI